jgi:uncharacterized flavoprotein (TIGR03862 family)
LPWVEEVSDEWDGVAPASNNFQAWMIGSACQSAQALQSPAMSNTPPPSSSCVEAAVIGGGPAGLMAAEALAERGVAVHVFDGMPSVGRKFLLAGKGGLNLTHSESEPSFGGRYGQRAAEVAAWLEKLDGPGLRAWAQGLGVDTFVGSSGRVFPADMKAAPLLRAWLHRLRGQGVQFHMRHRWLGFDGGGGLRFETPQGQVTHSPRASVLALGGASWQRLGSDGAWWPWLAQRGVGLAPLRPSNCGFDVAWTPHLAQYHAGAPIKSVAITFGGVSQAGEFVLTQRGVEGSLVYAFSAALRDAVEAQGPATFFVDLLPARDAAWVHKELTHPRGPRSLGTHLKSRLNLHGAKAALLWEVVPRDQQGDLALLARTIKALPITVKAPRPIDEAISSAGGVRFAAMDRNLMLHAMPGVFCAGEMLDWEAPTGGYLLTATMASGRVAGEGAVRWLRSEI